MKTRPLTFVRMDILTEMKSFTVNLTVLVKDYQSLEQQVQELQSQKYEAEQQIHDLKQVIASLKGILQVKC